MGAGFRERGIWTPKWPKGRSGGGGQAVVGGMELAVGKDEEAGAREGG